MSTIIEWNWTEENQQVAYIIQNIIPPKQECTTQAYETMCMKLEEVYAATQRQIILWLSLIKENTSE